MLTEAWAPHHNDAPKPPEALPDPGHPNNEVVHPDQGHQLFAEPDFLHMQAQPTGTAAPATHFNVEALHQFESRQTQLATKTI